MIRSLFVSVAMVGFMAVPSALWAGNIPDTGLEDCYEFDGLGTGIDCAGTGQDGEYSINPSSYTKMDANGYDLPDTATQWELVRDEVTGLIWEVKTDDGSIHNNRNYTWYNPDSTTNGGNEGIPGDGTDTEDFLFQLNEVEVLGGFTDWRIPTREELRSIVNYGRDFPGINTDYFPHSYFQIYWSADTYASNSSYAWTMQIGPGYGFVGIVPKSNDEVASAMAVRGKSVEIWEKWSVGSVDVATDTSTGLMWRRSEDGLREWQEALSHCRNMVTAGYEDWRLPTILELASIVSLDRIDPAINTDIFPNTPVASSYWSSTVDMDPLGYPFYISFQNGNDGSADPSGLRYVRAVRGGQVRLSGHLIISEPKQASQWIAGTPMQIAWDPVGSTGTVTIQLSKDGGLTYETIANATENDGQHTWTLTEPGTANGVIRIRHDTIDNIGSSVGLFSIIDQTPPSVDSIAISGPVQTNATQVQFFVEFSESVQGVNPSDFRLVREGDLSGGTIGNVAPSGGRYVVTVSGYAGLGTLGLELIDDDSITDAAGNPLGGPGAGNGDFSGGETYEISLEPEIKVSPACLEISEPDGEATFTVSLTRRPLSPVSIYIHSRSPGKCKLTKVDDTSITQDPTIVLDGQNWADGVSITVAANDDLRPNGDRETFIDLGLARSRDSSFDGQDPQDVHVNVLDVYDEIAITEVYPATGVIETSLDITIRGTGFKPGPTIILSQPGATPLFITNASVNPERTEISMIVPPVQWEGVYSLIVCNAAGGDCDQRDGALEIMDPEAAEKMKRKKAIIVAGGGDTQDQLWRATRYCANRAYQALIDQGFSHENIHYLSAGPAEENVDDAATKENLRHALLYWAKALDNPARSGDVPPELPADELIVYMTGHGDTELFRINDVASPTQQVSAGELAEMFRDLQYESPAMPGKLIFVYDACNAGSFLAPLAIGPGKERYVVASVPDQTKARFNEEGAFSFSGRFWNEVGLTGRLYRAFVLARNFMDFDADQLALIDIDSDGSPDVFDLNDIDVDVLIGRGWIGASVTPEFGEVMADAALSCGRAQRVWVSGLNEPPGVNEAWGILKVDEDDASETSIPIFYEERIDLFDLDGDATFDATVSGLTRNGIYFLNFYFQDAKGDIGSVPGQLKITRDCPASLNDAIHILKTLAGLPQPALDAQTFERMDADGNGRLGLPDALETLRLVGEM